MEVLTLTEREQYNVMSDRLSNAYRTIGELERQVAEAKRKIEQLEEGLRSSVPLSEDGRTVWIDGMGDVPLATVCPGTTDGRHQFTNGECFCGALWEGGKR